MKCILIALSFFVSNVCLSQLSGKSNSKFFISAGYGLAGSFFVRSYSEFAPVANYKVFQKKNFIGSSQNIAIGLNLKKNWDIKFGINFQHFTRRISVRDTLRNTVVLNIDKNIHHRDYIWQGAISKTFRKANHFFSFGLGLYYLRDFAENVEIYSNYIGIVEPRFKNSKEEQGGAFVESAYEYKFQPKVNIGVKTQFYYTLSTASAESITFFPYIKISL